MPSRKKSKPSFKVPEDLESAPQAGWVYRSDSAPEVEKEEAPAKQSRTRERSKRQAPSEEQPASETQKHDTETIFTTPKEDSSDSDSDSDSSDGIFDLTAKTFSSGMETLSNAFMLGAALLTAPIRMGLWMIGIRSKD